MPFYRKLSLGGAQTRNEIRGVKSLDALLHREDCAGFEDRVRGLISLAPIVQQSGLEQILKQCGSEKYGVHIGTWIALLRNEWRGDANASLCAGRAFGAYALNQEPDAFQITCIHRTQRSPGFRWSNVSHEALHSHDSSLREVGRRHIPDRNVSKTTKT